LFLFLIPETNISRHTLDGWRAKLEEDPNWRPYANRNAHLRLLNDTEEEELARVITTDFIECEKYCPSCCVLNLARQLWIEHHPNAVDMPKFSYKWLSRFLLQHRLSLRKGHAKRRSDPDDEIVAEFIADIDWIMTSLPGQKVINVDETCWRVIDGQLRTIARTGSETVNCRFPCDEKLSVTVIAGISLDGGKLPLWVITKGLTARCEAKIRRPEYLADAIRKGDLFVTHSDSGWMDKRVARQYVQWLRDRISGPMALIWDLFAAHREVKEAAEQLEITVAYIPAGQTDEWQPLDHRIFGSLKQRAIGRWNRQFLTQRQPELSVNRALLNLLESWQSIGEDEIQEAWDHLA
jgi:hypothetical protein